MNKKSIFSLYLFGVFVVVALFIGAMFITGQEMDVDENQSNKEDTYDIIADDNSLNSVENTTNKVPDISSLENGNEEPWLFTNPSDQGDMSLEDGEYVASNEEFTDKTGQDKTEQDKTEQDETGQNETGQDKKGEEENDDSKDGNTSEIGEKQITSEENDSSLFSASTETAASNASVILEAPLRELIIDSSQVDYMAYVPEMSYSSKMEVALDIDNPQLNIKAEAAILFDAQSGEVLYYKNPIAPVFPASTVKLLTSLIALDFCGLEEEVTIGDEIKMITADSTRANLRKGQVLTIKNLLEGMLLPSGNDAAYVIAAYVGRKSLQQTEASGETAVTEFVRLMNDKATELGANNSCFKTPDGYDAIGQYTTAYDMSLIGLAAVENEIILDITKKGSSRNIYVSGEDITWVNTNALVKASNNKYYSSCIGLKTGTSTMAGKCLISAGESKGRKVLSVVMNSTTEGRWKDTITLLDYGLGK